MKKIAVFPGSFDPITIGHQEIVRRGLHLFDEIVIGIGNNTSKNSYFPVDKRFAFIEKVFSAEPRVSVTVYEGLTIDFCKRMNANFIIRGLRTAADFEFERAIAQMNSSMEPAIETVFIISGPEYSPISSSIIREILKNRGDVSKFVPAGLDLS